MICDWAMLCHDIEPHPESGGFSIIGVFGKVLVDRLPGTLNPLNMAMRVSGTPKEHGTLTVMVLDPNGHVMKVLPPESIQTSGYGFLDFTAPLGPLSLRIPGLHAAVIAIDDIELRRVPLPVEKVYLS